jgi:hypothetical protein
MLLRSWRWDELLWWRLLLEACVAPGRLPVGLVCSATARWESRYSLLCKDNISCNNIYLIKTLVFCIHILAICMTTWSWAYIRWASGFCLKTGCESAQPKWLPYNLVTNQRYDYLTILPKLWLPNNIDNSGCLRTLPDHNRNGPKPNPEPIPSNTKTNID